MNLSFYYKRTCILLLSWPTASFATGSLSSASSLPSAFIPPSRRLHVKGQQQFDYRTYNVLSNGCLAKSKNIDNNDNYDGEAGTNKKVSIATPEKPVVVKAKLDFTFPSTADCDDLNTPPSLSKIQTSINSVKSGSDIRGTFVDHARVGSLLNVSSAIASMPKGSRIFTPFAAYCYGAAFAKLVQIRAGKGSAVQKSTLLANDLFPSYNNAGATTLESSGGNSNTMAVATTNICVGRDPRPSGIRIADAFCRGLESVDGVKAHYTNLASTPSMFAFCRSNLLDCDGGVMVRNTNSLSFVTAFLFTHYKKTNCKICTFLDKFYSNNQ